MENLALKNSKNQVVRLFKWEAPDAYVVYRKKIRRLDICHSLDQFSDKKDDIQILHKIEKSRFSSPLHLESSHYLELVQLDQHASLTKSLDFKSSGSRFSMLVGLLTLAMFSGFLLNHFNFFNLPDPVPRVQARIPAKVLSADLKRRKILATSKVFEEAPAVKKPSVKKPVKRSIKKMGVLAALGSLSKASKQVGGLNLASKQVSTSKGVGLRSPSSKSAGGGVQNSIYSKGFVTAALGSGGNIQGGGGYATKESKQGGGQAGYGQLTLVGEGGSRDLLEGSDSSLTSGFFDPSIIDAEIAKRSGLVHECYDQALERQPDLRGIFSVSMVIDKNGRVKSSKTLPNSQVKSRLVSRCVLAILNNIKFNITLNTDLLRIVYRFNLTALKEGGR